MLVTKQVRAVDPLRLARASGMGRLGKVMAIPDIPRPTLISAQLSAGCQCRPPQLGFVDLTAGTNQGNYSVLGGVSTGLNFIPVVGPIASSAVSILGSAISEFNNWLGIGKGRTEADIIVPRQDDLVSHLGTVTDQILLGMNPSVSQLDGLYREVWQLAVGFMEFVDLPDFTDRRASGQALNTIMPYIDGTCGYPVPLPLRIPYPSRVDCLIWGGGTVGGPGSNGMLGAIGRAIMAQGETVPNLPSMIDSANDGIRISGTPGPGPGPGPIAAGFSSPLAVGLGIAALFIFYQKRKAS
jgi:hypothetical protein